MRVDSVTFPPFVSSAMLCCALALGAMACAREEAPSNLAARSANGRSEAEADGKLPSPSKFPASSTKTDEATKTESAADATAPPAASIEPPPASERVKLALALEAGTQYVITTVGMLELPMVSGKPTAFARREVIAVSDCKGDGGERSCMLEHRYTEFEAEPPTGKVLEADEKRVSDLVTRHRIGPDGQRIGETKVEGSTTSEQVRQEMSSAHRFYCLRFPDEAVGVGAKWKASCETFSGGRFVERNVQWELSELSTDEDGHKRAELRMIGEIFVPDDDGKPRKGTVQGVLYFFVDHGKPHILRELHSVPLVEGKAAFTKRTLNMQFAHPVTGKPGELMRTDGQPLAATPLSRLPVQESETKAETKAETK